MSNPTPGDCDVQEVIDDAILSARLALEIVDPEDKLAWIDTAISELQEARAAVIAQDEASNKQQDDAEGVNWNDRSEE